MIPAQRANFLLVLLPMLALLGIGLLKAAIFRLQELAAKVASPSMVKV